ncbi:hypothetical protein [Laceyella putida]|uniref:Uncharacterized protein n=1 Tax=Laceyella putida TaxID=110101 RepID=A0ABW2RH18_9BACL
MRRGVTGHIASSITFIALVAPNPILCHPNIIIATDIHRTALFDQTMEFRNEIEHAHAIPPFRRKGITLAVFMDQAIHENSSGGWSFHIGKLKRHLFC